MITLNTNRLRIAELRKTLRDIRYDTARLQLVDTSSGTASGDSFDLALQIKRLEDYKADEDGPIVRDYIWSTVKILASTADTSMPSVCNKIGRQGAFGPTFDRTEVLDI